MHKYDIIDVIDQGAYGIVWKALNKETSRLVAIKEFKEGDEDEFSKKTIQREIKMLKMLKSQYVVGIKEAFKKKGKIYLIFQFFERNLLNLIEKYENGLEGKLINSIMYKIIKCLQFLHQKNIIHRDIKPQNLLLNSDYSILKICDFGFARFLPEGEYDLTEYVATRWYRSPQLLVGEPYGKPSDIWALGCILGELVDGQPMFPGDDELDQIYIIKKSIGNLTQLQTEHFQKNNKFANIQLPDVKRTDSIETRYLGKIQKNALSFMKLCLKMNPNERITVEEALKHPYLLHLSLEDNQFSNDQQNLLQNYRKNTIFKNQSKASIISTKEKDLEEKSQTNLLKSKFFSNANINAHSNKGLKMQGSSLPEKEIYKLNPINETDKNTLFFKKKSHTNLKGVKFESKMNRQSSPKLQMNKESMKKMTKIMSEEKNLNVNVDFNLKINLKINQKLYGDKKERKYQSKAQFINKLPEINQSKVAKYLNKNQKYNILSEGKPQNGFISIIGESKEIVKISKIEFGH